MLIFLICCYRCDTGARENKALIFEVLWALWWEVAVRGEWMQRRNRIHVAWCLDQLRTLTTRIYGSTESALSALLEMEAVGRDSHIAMLGEGSPSGFAHHDSNVAAFPSWHGSVCGSCKYMVHPALLHGTPKHVLSHVHTLIPLQRFGQGPCTWKASWVTRIYTYFIKVIG